MKAYIIRLKDNEFSKTLANDAYASVKSFGIDPIFFNGIQQDKVEEFFTQNSIQIKHSASSEVEISHWSLGTMGCFASHYALWKLCASQEEPFIIMEHDGIMLRNPEKILHLVDEVCHLDTFTPFVSQFGIDSEDHSLVYTNNVDSCDKDGVVDYPKFNFYESDTIHITGQCFKGAYGYIIKPIGAKKLLKFCERFGAFPADRIICQRAVKLQKTLCTYVRLHPFFKSIKMQRDYTTR